MDTGIDSVIVIDTVVISSHRLFLCCVIANNKGRKGRSVHMDTNPFKPFP